MALSRHEPEYLAGHSSDVLGGHKTVALHVTDDFVCVPNGDFL